MKDQSTYSGTWKSDKLNGQGSYYSADRAESYVGDWKDDMQHGHGIETWSDGTLYEGTYIEDKKQGIGKFSWFNGC
eukprot:CAMPEP_0176403306 /NCGR_PEP_ID=MMETSP0126-20121128/49992_1 /TAXON_ID=141414 ORGANISM="Strombidinopsis acuminatum, Strain SPMC142" /NCGR_SAMPLE_ID=MMETSP0126 /ASSEMBLY_ACC=CAM_ASM_000229 /LENGTH=75 /DNA_ID=CAMNT_0017781483 /DNA_START=541 /DNA_END=768 /DNA_ORIENTATION=+